MLDYSFKETPQYFVLFPTLPIPNLHLKFVNENFNITKANWNSLEDKQVLFERTIDKLGLPFVVKSPNQGSSIGVSVISKADLASFETAVNKSLFVQIYCSNSEFRFFYFLLFFWFSYI